jgi:hypothetical protein
MRRLLVGCIAVFCVLLASRTGRAQTAFTGKLQVYVDDDHTQVYSPLVRAQADVTPSTNVSAGYVADVVSSASIDIVSQASYKAASSKEGYRIHDVRHQVSVGLAHTMKRLVLSGGYTFSRENDYMSNVLSGGGQWLLNDKDTTLAFGGNLALNDVGRAGDPNFSQSLTVVGGNLSLTQIFTPTLIGQATYELQVADGFQSSPYRFVPVADQMAVRERDPLERVRHAVVLGLNRHVGESAALQADYRFYLDTWGISSHTVEARLVLDLGPRTELRLRSRTYVQSGASFYRPSYDQVETYMAIDRELSPLWSETVGAKLDVKLGGDIEVELKADGFYYHYDNFPLLPSRLGANIGLGVQIVY